MLKYDDSNDQKKKKKRTVFSLVLTQNAFGKDCMYNTISCV